MGALEDKMKEINNRYEEILSSLSDPAIAADQPRYQKLSRELSDTEPIVFCFRSLMETKKELAEVRFIFRVAEDEEIRELAREEERTLEDRLSRFKEELQEKLTPKDPNDRRSVIIEIRAGAGGEEAALFCGVMFRMYSIYAQSRGWKTE